MVEIIENLTYSREIELLNILLSKGEISEEYYSNRIDELVTKFN